ncbi:MAG: hypothetical protein JSR82_10545 [Verrucomicrobia bacterium]|nr:hypothetical protein [Verrucomicrobiota bacterium]
MKRLIRRTARAVAIFGSGLILAAAEPVEQVEMVDHYSLPILWDGREIGRRAFEPGKTLQVVRRVGGFLECRDGSQTFRLPVSVTDYERRLATGAGAVAGPAAASTAQPTTAGAPPAPVTPDPVATSAPHPQAKQPAPTSAAEARATPAPAAAKANERIEGYVEAVKQHLQEKPANARFFSYALVRRHAPSKAVRQWLTSRLADPALPAAERPRLERLKSAFLCYDLGRWADFEKAILDADAAARP